VFGVRLRRGLSVGGRGAGPGFINCPELYILLHSMVFSIDTTNDVSWTTEESQRGAKGGSANRTQLAEEIESAGDSRLQSLRTPWV
jgi:hypothetical protein